MTAYQNDSPAQWVSFVSLQDDVKPFMLWPSATTPQDQELQNTIDAACWWAQDRLGQPIAPTEFFHRFSGYSRGTIMLPYYPVLSVASVVEYWGVSGPHTLTEQTPAAQGGSDMYQLTPLTGEITRSFQGLNPRPFFPGLRNIEVTWTAGRNPIPPTYRRGILKLIKHWWDCDHQAVAGGFQQRQEQDHFGGPQAIPNVPHDIQEIFGTGQVGIG